MVRNSITFVLINIARDCINVLVGGTILAQLRFFEGAGQHVLVLVRHRVVNVGLGQVAFFFEVAWVVYCALPAGFF